MGCNNDCGCGSCCPGPQGEKGDAGNQGPQGPPSDKRLKDSITKLENNLGTIQKLKGVVFEWNNENEYFRNDNILHNSKAQFSGDSYGFIAQDVEKIIPGVVDTNDDGYKSIEYGQLVSLGIGSIQEQQKRIDSILERINKLKELVSG